MRMSPMILTWMLVMCLNKVVFLDVGTSSTALIRADKCGSSANKCG